MNGGEARVLGEAAGVAGVDLLRDHRGLEQAERVVEDDAVAGCGRGERAA
jgi:hypothetical protein